MPKQPRKPKSSSKASGGSLWADAATPRAKKPKAAPAVAVEYPVCARHAKARKDVRLRHYFLCDKCCRVWTDEAFAGSRSLYDGEVVPGICMLCNERKSSVRLRTWFLCDICHRVAGSIGRNHVAEQAILDFWKTLIQPRFPFLAIVQNDKSSLRARREASSVSGEGPLDFLITDTRTGSVVFGIENKTGRGSIRDMSEFQLDKSDCDSILHHMRAMSIPTYLIHAQVLENWEPPTLGFRTVGLWWTDVYRMTSHFKRMKDRADEKRPAAYFSKKAFLSIDSLPDALFDGDALPLVRTFKQSGIPSMYVTGT